MSYQMRSLRDRQAARRVTKASPTRNQEANDQPRAEGQNHVTDTQADDGDFVSIERDTERPSNNNGIEDQEGPQQTNTSAGTLRRADGTPPRAQPPEIGGGLEKASPSPEAGIRGWTAKLAQALWDAEDRGEPEETLRNLRQRFETAKELLQDRAPIREHPGQAASETKEASELLRALNAATPRPKLGDTTRPASPQQVEQWIRDIEGVFAMAAVTRDSPTRTLWVIGTISYHVHRELLQERLNDGAPKGWAWVKSEERALVQDPVLTKYENYSKFYNFTWKESDMVNLFLLHLGKSESVLTRSFFKTPTGSDDDEAKIAFVWAKIPDSIKREMQRHGGFSSITSWGDFERSLRNAESATRSSAPSQYRQFPDRTAGRRGKRTTSPEIQGNKRQDRRLSNPTGRKGTTRSDSGDPTRRQTYSSTKVVTEKQDSRKYEEKQENTRYEGRPDKKQHRPHWKQRTPEQGKQEDTGKAKP
jgi:hypothetical protein